MSVLESLDARGLLCPLPVIRTQDRVRSLPAGTLLEVLATDPGTMHDIPAWCRVHGHELIFAEAESPAEEKTTAPVRTGGNESGGGLVYRFRIQVCSD